jgi:hypothetical protein
MKMKTRFVKNGRWIYPRSPFKNLQISSQIKHFKRSFKIWSKWSPTAEGVAVNFVVIKINAQYFSDPQRANGMLAPRAGDRFSVLKINQR